MIDAIQQLIRGTDATVARVYLSMFKERNALMTFLFHSIFRDENEIQQNTVDPLQRTTLNQFRQFIEYYVSHGYRFVGPLDLLKGLEPHEKYVMVTFDDGYFNNRRVLPVLEEFGVPALFFISTKNVQENRSYWWDVLYRNRMKEGMPPRRIWQEAVAFKTLKTHQLELELARKFGANAFEPWGDTDRPLAPDELRAFAAHPLVHIGNHCADHAILTNYSAEEIRQQIGDGQDALEAMTGRRPISIAYPNGAFSDEIGEICTELGIKIGFTVNPKKGLLPLSPNSPAMLRLGRFTPHGQAPIMSQCRTYRSDVLFYGMFRDTYIRLRRRHAAY